MLIPYTVLTVDQLASVLDECIQRQRQLSTIPAATSDAQMRVWLTGQLEAKVLFVEFDTKTRAKALLPSSAVPENYRSDFMAFVAELDSELNAAEAEARDSFRSLYAEMILQGRLPLDLGQTAMTGGVKMLIDEGKIERAQLEVLLRRHSHADFGSVAWTDKLYNLNDVEHRGHILSRYDLPSAGLYVETCAGWHHTTVMLRSER